MSDKKVKCPWCGVVSVPGFRITRRAGGDVREGFCSECNQIIAAYLATEGNFLPKIRVFENTSTGGNK
jgi:hypothetical protein